MPKLISVLLNAYNLSLVRTIVGNLSESLNPLVDKSECTIVNPDINFIPICWIENDVSFIEVGSDLTNLPMRFEEGEIEFTGVSAFYGSKLIMADFAFSHNFRVSMYTLLKSAGIPKEAVKPYSSIPLALFKRESECLRIFNILPNLVQNRETKNRLRVIHYLDDILIVHQRKDLKLIFVDFPYVLNRMKLVLQADNLILTDAVSPVNNVHQPRPGGEIYVNFFNFGSWVFKKDLHLFFKKSEHFRTNLTCQESCCYDATNKKALTMKEKLTKFVNSLPSKGIVLEKYATLTEDSYDFPQMNESVFSKFKGKLVDMGTCFTLKFNSGDKENKIEQFRILEKESMDLNSYSRFFINKDRSSESNEAIRESESFSFAFNDDVSPNEPSLSLTVKEEPLDLTSTRDNVAELKNLALFGVKQEPVLPEEDGGAQLGDTSMATLSNLMDLMQI